MKSFFVLILFTLVCTTFARNCEPKCKPGTKIQRDCNTCICTEDRVFACTEIACRPPPPEKEPPHVCKPGSTFMSDCNSCTCNKYGTGSICTERPCRIPVPEAY